MSYKSLTNLYNDFLAAINKVSLGSFYMVDESEINKIKSINGKLSVLEIPNSSLSNINKAWEEYEISFFILERQFKSYNDYAGLSMYYDGCMDKFSEFISELLKQRNGIYVVDRESFEIERLNDFSVHLLSGIKVKFTLLAPSYLGFWTPTSTEPAWNVTSNLVGLWNGNKNVTRTSSAAAWTSWKHDTAFTQRTIIHSDSLIVPEYSKPSWIFDNESPEAGGLKLTNLTFSSASWTICLYLSIPESNALQEQILFRMTDPSNGDGFVFGLESSSNDDDGAAFYKKNDDGTGDVDDVGSSSEIYFYQAGSKIDLEPQSNLGIIVSNNYDPSSGILSLIHI